MSILSTFNQNSLNVNQERIINKQLTKVEQMWRAMIEGWHHIQQPFLMFDLGI